MDRVLTIVLLALAIRARAEDAPVHHVLEVRLDPAARTLRGVDRVRLGAHAPTAFALLPGFSVERVTADGQPIRPKASGDRQVLELDGSRQHEVVIEYRGTVAAASPGAEVAVSAAGPDGSYLQAAGWFPSFEGLFNYEVTIDVPEPQRAVTSGRLRAETTTDGRYRVTFEGDGAVEELSLFAGPYRITERMHRGWRVRTYFHESVADLAERYLDRTEGYLDLYDGWIGAYPYSGFAVVSSQFPVGLGFPGLTYLGTQVLRLPFIPDTSLGHEVLHSWWGDGVRVAPGGNWAEGLTTFMADYTFGERRGAEVAREQRLAWVREFSVLPAIEDRPLTDFTERRHTASQATGYHKAAFVFMMLRDEIGPEAFAAGVREFWQAHRFGAAGWTDLEAAFSSAASMPLGRFFEQWVRRSGAPRLSMRDVAADGPHVSFLLAQTVPPYGLDVPVVVETAGAPLVRTVGLDGADREYSLEVPDAPRVLAVDPDLRLFRRLARDEIPPIMREVAFDRDAVAVVAARDDATRAAARDVASALLERQPRVVRLDAPRALPTGPLVLVGTSAEVTAVLATAGLGVPAAVDKGTARAWAARRPQAATLVAVAAEDADGLRAVARPLPHYGAQSFVVFDGPRATDRGLWPLDERSLRAELRPATRPTD